MTIDQINRYCKDTLISHLDINFTELESGKIKAEMPVDKHTSQPAGILHGGASLALAETIAGAGSFLMVDPEKYDVLGIQVSGNHLSAISSGYVYATATIAHKGKTTHLWDVEVADAEGNTISLVRVTNLIKKKI